MPVGPPRTFMVRVSLEQAARDAGALLPGKEDQERMVRGLGAAATAYWKNLAKRELKSATNDYVHALSSEYDNGVFRITLGEGPAGREGLPHMIELGFKGGDMRQWMFGGKRTKRNKKGRRYLVIPFQHGTPGTTERHVGKQMPPSVHEAAKKLVPTLSRPRRAAAGGPTVRYGERLTERTPGLSRTAMRHLTTKKKPWHHSSIYRGMIREEKTFEKATQTTGYFTFRTISEDVIRGERDDVGRALQHWYHPGIRARHFAQKTQKHIRSLATRMLSASTKEPA
jgi:hypothetical protein